MLRRLFEHTLWGSRFLLVLGVVSSMLMALGAFLLATLDALQLPRYLASYMDPDLTVEARTDLRNRVLTLIVKAVDGYIITAVLIIFALGLYQLVMGRLEVARDSPVASQWLPLADLEDLKGRIANLLLLVLVIEFFQRALLQDVDRPLDLLYLSVGILLIGVTLWLGKRKPPGKGA
ncbi:YqhA family protein [Myxococcus sp. RHSTA-1-4]|uniref:YqhA family protein n=1 Tax=Myxococcus sp. RHSTA-1-4 TaxID=2874601 RepID=UPI001CBD9C1A|nr:YqhA family protein [Myxococcus sp. RHSTA-1-4]MBZ4416252.1 YqhA family protein [Myxococcus sp. RHSTA-1-4]